MFQFNDAQYNAFKTGIKCLDAMNSADKSKVQNCRVSAMEISEKISTFSETYCCHQIVFLAKKHFNIYCK